jgi:uncharacterized protein YceK
LSEFTCTHQFRIAVLVLLVASLLNACGSVHTLESTAHLNRSELLALCADLELRANMDCQWNAEERQSSIEDRQTWEIGCMARRESARDSFDNVCHPSRFGASEEKRQE